MKRNPKPKGLWEAYELHNIFLSCKPFAFVFLQLDSRWGSGPSGYSSSLQMYGATSEPLVLSHSLLVDDKIFLQSAKIRIVSMNYTPLNILQRHVLSHLFNLSHFDRSDFSSLSKIMSSPSQSIYRRYLNLHCISMYCIMNKDINWGGSIYCLDIILGYIHLNFIIKTNIKQ